MAPVQPLSQLWLRALEQKQPGFAASLECAASRVEICQQNRWTITDPAVRGGACSLPADDSVVPEEPARQRRTGSPHAVQARLGPQDRSAREIFNLLAGVAGDPGPAPAAQGCTRHISDLMVTAGSADGIILSGVARELEQYLGTPGAQVWKCLGSALEVP